MIIGNIEHLDLLPYLPIKLKEAIEFIKNNVNQNTPLGRYDIDGNNLFFMISENELSVGFARVVYSIRRKYCNEYA